MDRLHRLRPTPIHFRGGAGGLLLQDVAVEDPEDARQLSGHEGLGKELLVPGKSRPQTVRSRRILEIDPEYGRALHRSIAEKGFGSSGAPLPWIDLEMDIDSRREVVGDVDSKRPEVFHSRGSESCRTPRHRPNQEKHENAEE